MPKLIVRNIFRIVDLGSQLGFKKVNGAGEMAQQTKELAAKSDNLRLIP